MMKKKLFYNTFKCCFALLFITIIFGCSTKDKKNQIISLQKKRIHKLEKQLRLKNSTIKKLKVKKWANEKVVVSSKQRLSQLQSLMAKKRWVDAIQLSSKIKKQYPKSKQLRSMRIRIFQEMGLKNQARREKAILQKLRAQR
ncbi:MAG: hypothetical protein HRT44_08265 [Bdellovibrionales bacterium]|nr:hypothetical protein [Bdellovibrionales bacterium]NQZ19233.1 hypothetical protein [Bdellovibrionales bacterium]